MLLELNNSPQTLKILETSIVKLKAHESHESRLSLKSDNMLQGFLSLIAGILAAAKTQPQLKIEAMGVLHQSGLVDVIFRRCLFY
jgi:hypothetical protein